MTGKLRVEFPQSKANSPDIWLLEELLEGVDPALEAVNYHGQFGTGFSACRVYLLRPSFRGNGPSPNLWVVKIGPAPEIEAERSGLVRAKSHIINSDIVGLIHSEDNGEVGIIVYDYGADRGFKAKDLAEVVNGSASIEAISNVVAKLRGWEAEPRWEERNVAEDLKSWLEPKISDFPVEDYEEKVVYSPDFAEAYANPGYYLQSDRLPAHRRFVPLAPSHGDLNFHNVLFSMNSQMEVDISSARFIDFRHFEQRSTPFVDLAKLESTLRFQRLESVDNVEALEETIAFLGSSRASLKLAHAPQAVANKTLQDLWRCISVIRDQVSEICHSRSDTESAYWLTLASYAISTSTYPQLPSWLRRLAYLDGAALVSIRQTPFLRVLL